MRFSFLQGNPNKTMNSILGQAKSYLNDAREKEEKEVSNGKSLANHLRLIDSAEKYCNNNYANLYELSAARSTVLKNIKNSYEVFKVGPREIPYELYDCKTTLTSTNINERNKKALIDLFKNLLRR